MTRTVEISDKAVEAATKAIEFGEHKFVDAKTIAEMALSAALPHLGAAGVVVPECRHEPFEGRCVHCDAPYRDGRAVIPRLVPSPVPQEATAEPVAWDPRALAVSVANIRQGQSSTPRCEPPGEADIEIARTWVDRVLAAQESKLSRASPPSHDAELLAALRAALKPFADEAPYYDPPEGDDGCEAYQRRFLVGDLRAARSAVAKIDAALAPAASQEGR